MMSSGPDAVKALEEALAEAKAGQLDGVAMVILRPGKRFAVVWAGRAYDDPIRTLGTLQVLQNEVLGAVQGTHGAPPEGQSH
jgi:hypothetical protein